MCDNTEIYDLNYEYLSLCKKFDKNLLLAVIIIYLCGFYSGYGSQAVSSSNLTNDDVLSLRSMSISVDETPDVENKILLSNVEIPQPVYELAISTVGEPVVDRSKEEAEKFKSVDKPHEDKNIKSEISSLKSETAITVNDSKKLNAVETQSNGGEPSPGVQSADDESAGESTTVVSTGLTPGKVCKIIGPFELNKLDYIQ